MTVSEDKFDKYIDIDGRKLVFDEDTEGASSFDDAEDKTDYDGGFRSDFIDESADAPTDYAREREQSEEPVGAHYASPPRYASPFDREDDSSVDFRSDYIGEKHEETEEFHEEEDNDKESFFEEASFEEEIREPVKEELSEEDYPEEAFEQPAEEPFDKGAEEADFSEEEEGYPETENAEEEEEPLKEDYPEEEDHYENGDKESEKEDCFEPENYYEEESLEPLKEEYPEEVDFAEEAEENYSETDNYYEEESLEPLTEEYLKEVGFEVEDQEPENYYADEPENVGKNVGQDEEEDYSDFDPKELRKAFDSQFGFFDDYSDEEKEDKTEEKVEKTDENASREAKRESIRRKYMVVNDGDLNVANIMVIGIGGAGNNAVNRMISAGVNTAKFVAMNTDKQALLRSLCNPEDRYQIGEGETKGLGAGADPETGEKAAIESKELIEEIVDGVDLLFIAAGMGGGTGTGAAPIIAKIAKEKGCVTVAVVTKPFSFEGAKRAKNAEKGIANLSKHVDTIIIIPNDKLMDAVRADEPIVKAFEYADETLRQGVCGIADLIATNSLINLDFADVRAVLKNQGLAHIGIGHARGENRIVEAVKGAVSSPLLETTIEGAKNIVINVTGGEDLTLVQVYEAASSVREIVDREANVIFGMNINPELQEEVIITLIATGFDSASEIDDENAKAYNSLFAEKKEAPAAESEPEEEEEPAPAPAPQGGWAPDRGYGAYGARRNDGYEEGERRVYRPDVTFAPRGYEQAPAAPQPAQSGNYAEQPAPEKEEPKNNIPGFIKRLLKGKK